MTPLSRLAAAVLIALSVALPASAEERGRPPLVPESVERDLAQGFERLRRGVEALLKSLPQFQLPELSREGDIIIRRKPRPPAAAPRPFDELLST